MSFKPYKEEILESSVSDSVLGENRFLIDEGYWNDNELILAAELGKALLDRNRQLEIELEKIKSSECEKKNEIEILINDIANLREMNNQKVNFIDEIDRYNQEIVQKNNQLLDQLEKNKEKINNMSNTIASLKEQIFNLTDCQPAQSQQQQQQQMETYKPISKYHQKFKKPFVFSNNNTLSTTNNDINHQNSVRKINSIKCDNPTSHTMKSKFNPILNYHQRNSKSKPTSLENNQLKSSKCLMPCYRCKNSHRQSVAHQRYHHPHHMCGIFIDDDFSDQPELGAYSSVSNDLNSLSRKVKNSMIDDVNDYYCYNENYSNLMIRNYENSIDYYMGRAWSWPRGINEIHWDLNTELIVSSSLLYTKGLSEGAFGTIERCQGSLNLANNVHIDDPNVKSKDNFISTSNENQQNKTNTPNLLTDNLSKCSQSFCPSAVLVNATDKSKSDQLNDLLDDVQFVNCLDRIYNPHIRSQYCDFTEESYKPLYKQLFQDVFNVIQQFRNIN